MDVIARLTTAINTGDLDALVACFADGYRNETPVHPSRGFIGSDQVRRNWEQIFSAIDGLTAQAVRHTVDGAAAWVEWDWTGRKPDGTQFAMRGVTIFQVHDDLITAARFYMEPVDPDAIDVDAAVHRAVGGHP